MNYGATQDDWAHFDLVLGLTADLLPVVSNPGAEISDLSKMKAIGKTPSQYNQQRKVAGFPKWTDRRSTGADVERWAKEPDYGICLQTREIRALDIDIEDHDLAGRVRRHFERAVGCDLPRRARSSSGKQLLAFRVAGGEPLAKRHFRVEAGLVEFLATGQQFVAVGTHPSGARYDWVGGLPDEFPSIEADVFERAWQQLVEQFAVGDDTRGKGGERKRGADLGIEDPVVDWLEAEWTTYGWGGQGQLFAECPWKDGHSSDSGETEAAWFPAGTNGYEQGHFKCLHASCSGRLDEDFLDKVGFRASAFESLPAVIDDGASEDDPWAKRPLPKLVRAKGGEIEAIASNLELALRRPDVCGAMIAYDVFSDELLARWDGKGWDKFKQTDYFEIRLRLERIGFKPIGRELVRDAVHYAGFASRMDTAAEWLAGQVWDGVPRVERFLSTHFGADDSDYARSVARYMWTAQAGRAMRPGEKCDMVPVFIGSEGMGKSTGVAAIAPSPEQFAEFDLDDKSDDKARKMRGKLVGEISELRGLHSRDAEYVKAFVTRTHERWTPKYQEMETVFPRRLVFYGTANEDEFLSGSEGNRRWLPVVVRRPVDVEAIERDRGQLWAEARELWSKGGVAWQGAMTLAPEVRSDHRISDTWETSIERWLHEADITGETPAQREWFNLQEAASGALGLDARSISRREEMRIGKALKAVGCEKTRARDGDRQIRAWTFAAGGLV